MMIIAAVFVGMLASAILFLLKKFDGWKAWIALYCLWMVIAGVFACTNAYIQFSLTTGGAIVFIITLIAAVALYVVSKKRKGLILDIIYRLVVGCNYLVILAEAIVISLKMLYPIMIIIFKIIKKIKES